MLRHLARALIGAAYVQQGVEQLRHPDGMAAAARPYVARLSEGTPVPDNPALVVRVAGGVTVAAGLGLVTNTAPRAAAATLALLSLPATLLRHPVLPSGWRALRGEEGTRLLAELGLLGGAVIAAADTEGRPGLTWRARRGTQRLSRRARREVHRQRRTARLTARAARAARRHAARPARVQAPVTDAEPRTGE